MQFLRLLTFQVTNECLSYVVSTVVTIKHVDWLCRYVAFLSGLDIGDHNEDLMALQLMVDLLTGQLGDEGQQKATANIVRVVIAGNSLSQETQGKDQLSKVSWEAGLG